MQPSLVQEARQAILLLTEYAFELRGQAPTAQVLDWLETYRASWIRDAVVEALYQGRYKAISVQQILALWQRRGQPVRRCTKEFERSIATPLGIRLTASLPAAWTPNVPSRLPTQAEVTTLSAPLASTHDDVLAGDTLTSDTQAGHTHDTQTDDAKIAVSEPAGQASSSEDSIENELAFGLEDLSAWDGRSPSFVDSHLSEFQIPDPQVVRAEASSEAETVSAPALLRARGYRTQRSARAYALAISTDRGVLTSAHQPIQPFRPELPSHPRRYL